MVTPAQREQVRICVDWHAPVVRLLNDGVHIGSTQVDGAWVKRATFVCGDLARDVSDRLHLTDTRRRRAVIDAVLSTAWEDCTFTAHGRQRRWFETDEMVEAIVRAADG